MPRLAYLFWFLVLLLSFSVSAIYAEKNLARPPGTTRYAAMVQELNALVQYDQAHAGCMTLSSLGKSVQGRDLWMVTVKMPGSPMTGDGNTSHKSIFYLCRQHGHEPASTEGALAFLTTLVKAEKNTPLANDLANVTVYVVPMANPDGAEAFRRHNAHDVDLNRDWLRRTQPETRALYTELQHLHPDLVTDQHELYPDDARPDFTETAGPGSGAKPDVISACDETQAVVQGAMQAEGFATVSHLVTDTHPARLAHRYISVVAGLPTVLFETNRLTGTGRTVADRAAAHAKFMMIVLRDMAGERPRLLAESAAWDAAHREMLASRHKMPQRPTGKATAVEPSKGTD